MTASIVERLRDKSLVIQHPERDQIANLIEQQAKEITELRLQSISDSGQIIESAKEIAELKALANKLVDALELVKPIGHVSPQKYHVVSEALSAYRELIKE